MTNTSQTGRIHLKVQLPDNTLTPIPFLGVLTMIKITSPINLCQCKSTLLYITSPHIKESTGGVMPRWYTPEPNNACATNWT